ncbi:hypothetical protein [Prosthecomicrobium pneumaticum]|uniref:Uncharacterized protein n=1 Tax=Prosthecomicrobium pneumaticum TaxID=81895 RepID=A0A7W9CT59_9HYPH|nr:hypothetical protein [Prosthecomicrobium pneumaticum]MBB5751186.1 hypothetical protein [Prosthecomicrobium pneumaticum]
MTYVLAFYWPYMAVALGLGVVIGWWTEGRREIGEPPKSGEGGS